MSSPPRGTQAAVTDSKKEAFRQYLERAGVIDTLTKVLVSLYEEPDKPKEAIKCVAQLTRTATSPCACSRASPRTRTPALILRPCGDGEC